MEYSVAIRTLGKAGDKYRRLLESINAQSCKPAKIVVYIADGYEIPTESIGIEQYVYVAKGMVAQRALKYEEIDTEYILFLDDDVELKSDSVERMYNALMDFHADVIAPDVFDNSNRPFLTKLAMLMTGRMLPRHDDGEWAYKIIRTGGYSYNNRPRKSVYRSQTNAGPCFFCRKSVFMDIRFDEELWLDMMPYALGDDQAMFYKMHLYGYKVLTIFDSGIKHLDAGSTLKSYDKVKMLAYCDLRFKCVFWHRFIYIVERNKMRRILAMLGISYYVLIVLLASVLKFNIDMLKIKVSAIKDSYAFIMSDTYRLLPPLKSIS